VGTRHFEGLDDPAKSKVVHEIGLFALTIIVEGSVVQAERDGNNNPLDTEALPVMPADVCKLPTRTFVRDVLDRFRGHIKKHWSEENIDTIEDDHKELVDAAKNDDATKKILESHDEKVFFKNAWDAITSKKADGTIRFAKLRQFCDGSRPPSRTRARWNRTSPSSSTNKPTDALSSNRCLWLGSCVQSSKIYSASSFEHSCRAPARLNTKCHRCHF
jgi:hypothetical protein